MNVIEAAKAAGWPQTAIDMASKQEIERLERFAQVIRNQALEDAAKVCDECAANADRPQFKLLHRVVANSIRALKGAKE